MLFKSLNSVDYPYTFVSHCYAGSPEGTPNQYYIKGTDEYTKYLVTKMATQVPLAGRNLTMDRLYTSIPIAEWLWNEQKMTMIGTFQSNRKGFPAELKKPGPNKTSSIFYQVDGPLVLAQYCTVTKSKGAVSIVILTTRTPMDGVTQDDQQKPAIFKLYDFTKTGTDQMDSRFSTGKYCSKPTTRRWSIAFFSYIMDTTRVNIQTLVTLNNGGSPRKVDSFAFGKKLALGLISPYLEKKETAGLTPVNLLKLYLVTNENRYLKAATKESSAPSGSNEILPFKGQSSQTPTRCGSCIVELRDISAAERYKGKNSLTKSSGLCEKCGVVKCNKKHLVKLCISCFKSL